MDLSRRDLLTAGGLTLAGTTLTPRLARAQAPKRGGTLSLRLWDPPHFDLHAPGGLSYKLHIALTFTHSRLVKPKAGPNVQPGTFPIEGDLAAGEQNQGPGRQVVGPGWVGALCLGLPEAHRVVHLGSGTRPSPLCGAAGYAHWVRQHRLRTERRSPLPYGRGDRPRFGSADV